MSGLEKGLPLVRGEPEHRPFAVAAVADADPATRRVAHLFPRAVMEEYVLQRVTERVW